MQKHINAPKSQYNNFGKFWYRNCEDVLVAAKEIAPEGVSVVLTDEVVAVLDRVYVKAKASIVNNQNAEISVTAFAREPLIKKGMDESQITGAASSYARKYALCGLFAIDDNKDADTQDNRKHEGSVKYQEFVKLTSEKGIKQDTMKKWLEWAQVEKKEDFTDQQIDLLMAKMKEIK